jgi:hypothetical protein
MLRSESESPDPVAVICAAFVAADVLLNDGTTLIALNKMLLHAGQALGQQISKILE